MVDGIERHVPGPKPLALASVGEQEEPFWVAEQVAGHPAEDHFFQPIMSISTGDDKVCAYGFSFDIELGHSTI